MLTKLTVSNFKSFDRVEVELGNPVVFVGPNNSGKSTALQALALWRAGVEKWFERRGGDKAPEKRPGVTINRRDLFAVPVPSAKLLWRDLHLRESYFEDGKQKTRNVRIDIEVAGVTNNKEWRCGLEFDYANEESFYCRPLRLSDTATLERMDVPEEALSAQVAFLPPMSGLASEESRLDPGAVSVRVGEGRTAEVLRNLCYQVFSTDPEAWDEIVDRIRQRFLATLLAPQYIEARGALQLSYTEGGTELDIASAGRGLQQTLLLLAYLCANPGSALLLDEPDAHLEILRQRHIYGMLSEAARAQKSQLIVATHSKVLLNEAAGRDVVVAFLDAPHRIDDRFDQLRKSLREIESVDYYLAKQKRWVLYLEGSTDLAILQEFARTLDHPVAPYLEEPFVSYLHGNEPSRGRAHFYGVREAVPELKGVLLIDRFDKSLGEDASLRELMWKRREIENYLCYPTVLEAYAIDEAGGEGSLFAQSRADTMRESLKQRVPPAALDDPDDRFWTEAKVSDDLLEPVFEDYYKQRGTENLMRKTNYHRLARFVPKDQLDPEAVEKLDAIHEVAAAAEHLPHVGER